MNGNRTARASAFTLVEVLLVLAIIAGIAALVIPNLMGAREEAKIDQTRIGIEKVFGAIQQYAMKFEYPTAEQGLKPLVEQPTFEDPAKAKEWRSGGYCNQSDLKDAWGTDLAYKLEEVTDSTGRTSQKPRIYSFGLNKTDDQGEGDDIKNKAWQDESAATK